MTDDRSPPADTDDATRLPFELLAQPNDSTCGPTCLHGVYGYFGDPLPLDDVIAGVRALPTGGTLAVSLGCHALRRGYRATIYTCNLQVFDPTWFAPGVSIPEKLRAQRSVKSSQRLSLATDAYLEFFELGGRMKYEDLNSALFRRYLRRGIPILTGLSATHLYRCSRERDDGGYDDVAGVPVGHFVVLSGYDPGTREVLVADPLANNPGFGSQNYRVRMDRLIAAILLGIVTYDANLLVIEPSIRKPAQ
jgi:hypothetical protein